MVVGTAGYMSPEQVRGEVVDVRSDIFSVGAVLHEMLTGRPAFTRATTAETMVAILKEDPGEPLGNVPASARAHRSRCLDKTRETRFQSARDCVWPGSAFRLGTAMPATGSARGSRLGRPRPSPSACDCAGSRGGLAGSTPATAPGKTRWLRPDFRV